MPLMTTHRFSLLVAFCALVAARVACGYAVGPALTLEKLAAEADLIFKGEVIGTEPVQDEWFKPIHGYRGARNALQGHLADQRRTGRRGSPLPALR